MTPRTALDCLHGKPGLTVLIRLFTSSCFHRPVGMAILEEPPRGTKGVFATKPESSPWN